MKRALGFWTGGLHIFWGLTGAGGGVRSRERHSQAGP